jgi:hypothetical protein
MTFFSFEDKEMSAVGEALAVAEDKIGDYYKFSFGQWKRHQYDVKTLSSLNSHEMIPDIFAILSKRSRVTAGYESKTKKRDFYYICLQDHQILKAVQRDKELSLFPLLVYIFTHELVHVVRFCNFQQRFEITGKDREMEEKTVHQTTFGILQDLSLSKLDYILDSYESHRICNLAVI